MSELERITDPATIRNIDWADHYETTTHRGAPMTEPTFLGPVRDEIDRLRAENERLRAQLAQIGENYGTDFEGWKDRLELAEARVDQLTNLLTLRTEALNRTGASNDRLRAALSEIVSTLGPDHICDCCDDDACGLRVEAIEALGIAQDALEPKS